MLKLIFSNRYAALIWVGLALFGAAAFVGKGGGVDALGQTAQRLRGQQAELEAAAASGQTAQEPAAAEEEEPAIEPTEAATPEAGDIVTGQDGRRYRVIQPSPAPETEPAEEAAH